MKLTSGLFEIQILKVNYFEVTLSILNTSNEMHRIEFESLNDVVALIDYLKKVDALYKTKFLQSYLDASKKTK